MKKILIVETGRLSKNSTVAHIRNSYALCEIISAEFDCTLVDLEFKHETISQYDVILFSYAGMGCDYSNIDEVINAQKNCRIGWVTNEFELFANEYVKQKMDFIITNFEAHGIKKAHKYKDHLMVNLNTLIFEGVNEYCEKKYDFCYYGTYRKYRELYFKKYFKSDFILSTTKKNFKKFMDLGVDCNITDKFNVISGQETLNLFKSALYIEDTKTHDCFNFMANRFYESLQCNTALFFDKSCINTINKDVYEIDDYFIIDSYSELVEKTANLDMNKLTEHTYTNAKIAKREKDAAAKKINIFLDGVIGGKESQKDMFLL